MPLPRTQRTLVDDVHAVAHRLTCRLGHLVQRLHALDLAHGSALGLQLVEVGALVRVALVLEELEVGVLDVFGCAQRARCDLEVESRAVLAAEEVDEILGGIENAGAVRLHSMTFG